MPMLGADMEAGTLVEWLKHPGDAVKRGDIIAVVDTEKGAIEIEVFEDGILDRLMVDAGQKVPVGTVLAHIQESGEAPATGAPVTAAPPALAPPIGTAARGPSSRVAGGPSRGRTAPCRSRRPSPVPGPGGAVTLSDVEKAASRGRVSPLAPTEAAAPVDRAAAMRRAIAAAMARSKREIPHLYLAATIDMSRRARLAVEGKRAAAR